MADNSANGVWGGFLTKLSSEFDTKVASLNAELKLALEDLHGDGISDPQKLARYQSLSSDYQVYRQAQSGVVKSYKDVATSIISNFR